ncbi:MAG: thioesterase family protein [Candidatus Methanoplasma sp.]|jgi:predicted thioesterase|nr:thioesterase family protein [Candidatus Methanoplasma sp.]
MISEGIIGEGEIKVTCGDTAAAWGSGVLPVFATPAMILLIEKTASECLMPLLREGESTVGTLLEIKHSAPSAVGSEVRCRVEVVSVDRSKILFDVRVRDSAGEIGSGRHERFLVSNEKFMSSANARLDDCFRPRISPGPEQ